MVRFPLAVLIPAYNEGPRLVGTLTELGRFMSEHGWRGDAVVVDDGSRNAVDRASLPRLPNLRVHLLRHPINLGQGGALQTAVDFARDHLGAETFVTLDADGQHAPSDMPRMIHALESADIVFGSRFAGVESATMPSSRRLLLRAARTFERALTGLRLTDAHNGYRAFNRATASVLALRQNRMAHATEFKQTVARHRLRYAEVPVQVTYSDETLAKGQRNTGSLMILRDLLRAYLFNG
ncbi:MAG: glycosyltransferase family 2 protein [Myxococcaceae bacterium]